MEKVPITRFKASLATYLARVKAGHSLVITDRDQAVAVFEPVSWKPEDDEAMGQLVMSGQVTLPTEELPNDFFELPRVQDAQDSHRAFLSKERGTGRLPPSFRLSPPTRRPVPNGKRPSMPRASF
jgi:antitoxin (DNA-binding transcriptional repressor) of toxin-antitoxin stability system